MSRSTFFSTAISTLGTLTPEEQHELENPGPRYSEATNNKDAWTSSLFQTWCHFFKRPMFPLELKNVVGFIKFLGTFFLKHLLIFLANPFLVVPSLAQHHRKRPGKISGLSIMLEIPHCLLRQNSDRRTRALLLRCATGCTAPVAHHQP